MSPVVLDGQGRAVIFNRVTRAVLTCSVPTALENVANAGGVWVHGETGEPWDGPATAPVAVEPAAVIALTEPGVLPLPAAEVVQVVVAPIPSTMPAPAHPLDHDGNGRKGGTKKPVDPERASVIAALKAANVTFFAGAPTDKLKALLPG